MKNESFYGLMYPRQAVLVTTVSEKGANCAPFTFTMPVSIEPPLVAFACYPKHHTFRNIKKNGEFVMNILPLELSREILVCGEEFPYGVDELGKAGLGRIRSKKVVPPSIKEALASIECRLAWMKKAGEDYVIVGRVLHVRSKPEATVQKRSNLYIGHNRFAKIG